MAQATVELFRTVTGNDFVEQTDEFIQCYLNISENFIGKKICPDVRHMLVVYDAAHRMTLAFRGGGVGGPITSESEGQLSRSFGTVMGADPLLSSTSYGQLLQSLRASCIMSAQTAQC